MQPGRSGKEKTGRRDPETAGGGSYMIHQAEVTSAREEKKNQVGDIRNLQEGGMIHRTEVTSAREAINILAKFMDLCFTGKGSGV